MMSANPSRLREKLAGWYSVARPGWTYPLGREHVGELLSTLDRQQAVLREAEPKLATMAEATGSGEVQAVLLKVRAALSLLESEPQASTD